MQASTQCLSLENLGSIIDFSPLTVVPESRVLDAIALMATYRKGVVVKSGVQVIGCLIPQDLVQLIASGIDLNTAQISEVMYSPEMIVRVQEVHTCLSVLRQRLVRLIVVVDETDQLIGTITAESMCFGLNCLTSQLQESETKFRAIFNSKLHCSAVLTPEGMIVELNQRALELGELKPEEVYNLPFWEMQCWSFSQTQQQIQEAIAIANQGEIIHCELDILQKNSETSRIIDFSIKPVIDQTGKVILLIAEARDIHDLKLTQAALKQANEKLEQQVLKRTTALEEINHQLVTEIGDRQIIEEQLRQSQQMLQLIMDNIPQSIFWKDRNSVYLGCNLNFAKVLSFEHPEDVIGKTDYDFLPSREEAEFYRQCDAKVMQTDTPMYRIIEPLLKPNGEQTWLETNKVPLHDKEGRVIGVLCTFEDITDRKQAQENLEKSEQRFRFLAESIPQQVWITKTDGSIQYVNQRTLDYFNFTPDKILSRKWPALVHPEDWLITLAAWSKSIVAGENYEVEFRLFEQASKTYRWHLGRALPLKDEKGEILNWFGTNTDINDRVTVETALRDSERRYHTMAAVSPVGIFRTDAQGACFYVNERWCEITGISLKDAIGTGWMNAIDLEDREQVYTEWYQAIKEKLPFNLEYRFQRPDGTVRWVFGQAVPELGDTGEVISYVGTITDISDRKLVEQALAERVRLADFRADVDTVLTQSETLESLMRGCTDALVKHLDAAFARIWVLNQEQQVLELKVSSGIYTHINGQHKIVPVGKLKIGSIVAEGKPYITNSVQDDPDISSREWAKQEGMVAFAGYPLIVEGETLGAIAMFSRQPITESTFTALCIAAGEIALGIKRKQTQTALQESEERFRNLVETTSDWVWEVDENLVYTYVSPKVREILGYEPQEILGKTPFEFMPPTEVERIKEIFRSITAKQQTLKCLENINIHRDGHLVVLETNGVPIVDCEGKFRGYRGIDRDITLRQREALALKETQQQLQSILDNSPAVIYLMDTENKYLLINRQYEKLFNTTQKEITGKSLYDVWSYNVADVFATNNSEVLVKGTPIKFEEAIPQADGLHIYLSVKFPLKDAHGITYAVCGISTDITERKRVEENLRYSEELFRLLVEGIQDYALYMIDPGGRVISWNSGAEAITGYQAAEIIGRDFSCFFRPEDLVKNLPAQQLEITNANGRCECETMFVRKNGSYFWANCILTALRDQNGTLRGFAKITRDITERKLAEKSLLRLRKAIESTSDAISIVDTSGEVTYVNPAFIELFDYNCDQLNSVGGLLGNFTNQEILTTILATVNGGESWRGEVTMQVRSGCKVQIDLRTDAIKDTTGKIVAFVSIYTNITQRKLIEEGLRLRDRAIAASSNGILIADVTQPSGIIIYVNPAFEQMTGYTSAEAIGEKFPLFLATDSNQPELQKLNAAMEAGENCTVILQNYRRDGSLFWNELSVSPVYDPHGELSHYIGIQTDITERKQAETALLLSQQRLQYLLTSSPAVIYSSKTSGDYGATFISANIKTMMGYEAELFINDSGFWLSLIHPEDKPHVLTELSKKLAKGKYSLEYRLLHQDNTYRWIDDRGKIIWDESGNPLECVGYLSDISDRKQLEQDLRIALEKEKELNELKSRFITMTSHEFRTPLSTILSSSELLEHYRQRWTQEKQLTHLHRIQTAVKRMTEMLNDILVIGKAEAGKLEYVPISFDLVEYCRQLVEEIRLSLRNKYLLYFSSLQESMPCCMDEKLLNHILVNLISNAIKYSLDDTIVTFTLSCKNGQAVFEIQDQGIGIPEEDIPRLFESFHRASNVGNIVGTGLGLAIVKKCIDIHEGEISVISNIKSGTKFTVTLPLNKPIQNEEHDG
ncbi:PAS domain S-box protein [Cronbergia sp. UHCC 0137]|uniref:PAS domain S-box protein n=1 Tax=Cronbergia sp. UHCC 0137 TaxID=3110239 RepID=UPI002B1F6E79|nr:PAS domain S-box protein [Cronbergia sp. UHCC 0137]MEA5620023.1 PAS domain S-box protein [Cronbergia sp. UHCC 0137]